MFGFIKKLFAGIFGFLGSLVGGKKPKADGLESNAPKTRKGRGYYLELDESQASKPASKPAEKAEPAKAGAPSKLEIAQSAAPVATAEPVKVESASKSKAVKAPTTAATVAPAKVEPAPKPEPAKTPAPAPAPAASANGKKPEQSATTFAPNYLLGTSSTNGRRRPGANMTSFLDMARQVKARA